MKRRIAAGLSILAVVGGVGWNIACHPETSTRLHDVSLVDRSEHSQPGPSEALAGIRIRLSPSDFGNDVSARAGEVPQVTVAAE